MRHPQEGAARLATEFSGSVSWSSNAGDGAQPASRRQTLLDPFTIQETQGRPTILNVAMVGDLSHGCTVHSAGPSALAKISNGNRFYFIAPGRAGDAAVHPRYAG